MSNLLQVRSIKTSDKEWLLSLLNAEFGSEKIAIRGNLLNALNYPGYIAEIEKDLVGAVIFEEQPDAIEIITINSIRPKQGVGGALIEKVIEHAKKLRKRTIKVITTNDNTHALRFYQKRGFFMTAFFPNSITLARKLKPEMPTIGNDGIPIRDEIELQMNLI